MQRVICIYGDPALRRKAEPVSHVDEAIRRLAQDMLASMYAHNGVGLAAEQIGRTEAILVIDTSRGEERDVPDQPPDAPPVQMPLVMINPEITEMSGAQYGPEGCLSFPEIFVKIKRAAEITANYRDVEDRPRTVRASGLLARAIQHEIDHLNGVLLVDRMSPVQKAAMAGRLKRLKKRD